MRIIRFLFLTISIAMLYANTYAQKNQWTVNPGESIREALGDSVLYKYPQFVRGAVYYKDGTVSYGSLNYNLLIGEMQFIAPSKDTLAIANENTISYITIQADTFYFDKVYIELIRGNDEAKLGKLEIIKLNDITKEGAYGQMSSTSAISTTNSFAINDQSYKLTEKKAITLHKETIFFIGDSLNNFLSADKKNIYKMFSKKKSAIESYIKENKPEFTKETNLVRLIDFLGKI
ncbi:MAG: hypothetical protein ABI405_00755 [Parafilimonas sp.]